MYRSSVNVYLNWLFTQWKYIAQFIVLTSKDFSKCFCKISICINFDYFLCKKNIYHKTILLLFQGFKILQYVPSRTSNDF